MSVSISSYLVIITDMSFDIQSDLDLTPSATRPDLMQPRFNAAIFRAPIYFEIFLLEKLKIGILLTRSRQAYIIFLGRVREFCRH